MKPYTRNVLRKALSMSLMIIGAISLVVALTLIKQPKPVMAERRDLDLAVGQYPSINDTNLDSCDLCHTVSGFNMNPYGQAYRSNGRSSSALRAIENLDSDGDGFTNIVEINALTFPGNANSRPPQQVTSTPTMTRTATRTSTVTATRTSTGTATVTTVPPTATNTRTTTATTAPPTATNTRTTTATTIPPTATMTRTTTATATVTPVPPTATATRTSTATAVPLTRTATITFTASATAVPPTRTATPTVQTSTPTRTATASPQPTATRTPVQLVLRPEADTFISRKAPLQNFGQMPIIIVDNRPAIRGLLRFQIPALNVQNVRQVLLRVYVTEESNRGFSVREVEDENWVETEVNYRNAPDREDTIARARETRRGQWNTVDITDFVKAEGTGLMNLALYAHSTNGFIIASRESGGNAPQLVITYNP